MREVIIVLSAIIFCLVITLTIVGFLAYKAVQAGIEL